MCKFNGWKVTAFPIGLGVALVAAVACYSAAVGAAASAARCESPGSRSIYLVSTGTGALKANFPDTDSPAEAAVSDGYGGWFVGGAFGCVGGNRAIAVAHLRSDGRFDRSWNGDVASELSAPGGYVDGGVTAMALGGNVLFLASSAGVHALDARTGRKVWFSEAEGKDAADPEFQVSTLDIDGEHVYVGGDFSRLAGQDLRVGGFAVLSARTGKIVRVAPLSWRLRGGISALRIAGRSLFVAGDFAPGKDGEARSLSKFRVPSLAPMRWIPRSASGRRDGDERGGHSLVVAGRTVWVAGDQGFRTYDVFSGLDAGWGARVDGRVLYFAVSGHRLYVGGGCRSNFVAIDGMERENVAVINVTTSRVQNWKPDFDGRYCVNAIAADARQVLLVGYLEG